MVFVYEENVREPKHTQGGQRKLTCIGWVGIQRITLECLLPLLYA